MKEVTLVITSCNRIKLLNKTIESFKKYNTYPIKEKIIIEDSGNIEVYKELKEKYGHEFKILFNNPPLKQIKSIDKAYSEVNTEYIFHCEDDWLFYRPRFIEDSFKVLKSNPLIKQVFLRSIEHDLKINHKSLIICDKPNEAESVFFYDVKMDDKFKNKNVDWSTVSFNPGLIRKKDYNLIGSYSVAGFHEADISLWYKKKGFKSVAIENDAVKHIGWDDSTMGHYNTKVKYSKFKIFIKAFLNLFGFNYKY